MPKLNFRPTRQTQLTHAQKGRPLFNGGKPSASREQALALLEAHSFTTGKMRDECRACGFVLCDHSAEQRMGHTLISATGRRVATWADIGPGAKVRADAGWHDGAGIRNAGVREVGKQIEQRKPYGFRLSGPGAFAIYRHHVDEGRFTLIEPMPAKAPDVRAHAFKAGQRIESPFDPSAYGEIVEPSGHRDDGAPLYAVRLDSDAPASRRCWAEYNINPCVCRVCVGLISGDGLRCVYDPARDRKPEPKTRGNAIPGRVSVLSLSSDNGATFTDVGGIVDLSIGLDERDLSAQPTVTIKASLRYMPDDPAQDFLQSAALRGRVGFPVMFMPSGYQSGRARIEGRAHVEQVEHQHSLDDVASTLLTITIPEPFRSTVP
jgi:hypothetical protein